MLLVTFHLAAKADRDQSSGTAHLIKCLFFKHEDQVQSHNKLGW